MRKRTKALTAMVALGMLGVGAWMWSSHRADAADHNDPPSRVMAGGSPDRAADIADLYAWHTDEGKTIFVLTYAGPNDPTAGQTATFDPDVLYGIHVDGDGDQEADHDIWVRFGQSASGNWGVQLEGVPGADGTQAGPVETVNRLVGVTNGFFWTGLREDPFFFDLQGFQETASTGTLSFMSTRDFFAGKNSSAIVIELETADLMAGDDDTFDVWATSSRIGG